MNETLVPYLRVPCFVDGAELHFARGSGEAPGPLDSALIRAVFEGGATLDSLARDLVELGGAEDREAAARRLEEAFARPEHAIGLVSVELPEMVDLILVEPGYGGDYAHSLELLRKLRERWKCLLVCPVDPPFESALLPEVLTLERLREAHPELDSFAWIQIVRTLVKRSRCRLLLLMHRSQGLYLFDLLDDRKTVIYCDGIYDEAFRRARNLDLDDSSRIRHQVLGEVFYLLSSSNQDLLGFATTPSVNFRLLMAGGFSLSSRIENWCWGPEQRERLLAALPDLEQRTRLMPPFTHSDLFRPDRVTREQRVLYTTTARNLEQQGLPELVHAMERLRTLPARCVVSRSARLPTIPEGVEPRMEIGSVTREEMIRLYHQLWVNCRTSREDSSPMSILESMTCELPQIVSPRVARLLPIIEDGVTGFVVDPDDANRLVRALKTIIGDRRLRDRMGRECRRRALSLSFESRVHEFERLLT